MELQKEDVTVVEAVAKEQIHYSLNNVRVEPGKLVATDGRILVTRDVLMEEDEEPFEPFLLDGKALKSAAKSGAFLRPGENGCVKIRAATQNNGTLIPNGTETTLDKGDSSYPDYVVRGQFFYFSIDSTRALAGKGAGARDRRLGRDRAFAAPPTADLQNSMRGTRNSSARLPSILPEALLRKCPTAPGLEIGFEGAGFGFVGEGERNDQGPGGIFPGSFDAASVVLGKALLEARGQANITAVRVRNALDEVDGVQGRPPCNRCKSPALICGQERKANMHTRPAPPALGASALWRYGPPSLG